MTGILKELMGLKSGNPDRLRIPFTAGFGAHLFEVALVFSQSYRMLWSLSFQKFEIGVIKYTELYLADKF